MEAYTAVDDRPLDLCLRDVANSDIYVGLYAWRYGYEPPADHGNPHGKSITELEYRHAETARLAEPVAVHRKLLDAWGDTYHLPHDYAWRWFGWHCVRANERDRLLRLLHDFDWLSAKLAATEVNALVDEFDHLRGDPLAELLQGVCRLSRHVLARDKSQLPGQLLARIPTP
jgi:hypothetical protein